MLLVYTFVYITDRGSMRPMRCLDGPLRTAPGGEVISYMMEDAAAPAGGVAIPAAAA